MKSMINRRKEIFKLLSLNEEDVIAQAKKHLLVFNSCDEIHGKIARDMADFIKKQNDKKEKIRFILPVGPVGQYPIFLDIIHTEKISLKNCYFFYMDEYADNHKHAYPSTHPLSFKGEMQNLWLNKTDKRISIPKEQIFFPSEKNIHLLADKIKDAGGIDICFGGIGLHGHLAFNEPEPGVRHTDPRIICLNDYTVAINTIRAKTGGNIEAFPRQAFTLGMKQIMESKKIRLACRNGIDLDWANTVLRLTLFGEGGDDYPCTYVNQHPDYKIYTDKHTLKSPDIILE
jgi:glucosamine-6-phosphate deaminase